MQSLLVYIIYTYSIEVLLNIQMGCCWSSKDVLQRQDTLDESLEKKEKMNVAQSLPTVQNTKLNQNQFLENGGQKFKLLGNESFKNKNYDMAIKYYQQAIIKSTSKPDISYFSNLALAFKANSQYKESISTIDQMMKNPKFEAEKNSPLFAKCKLIKARSIMMIVKQYCLAGKFSQKNNHEHLLMIDLAIQILQEINSQPKVPFQNQEYLEIGLKVKQFLVNQIMPKSENEKILQYLKKKFINQNHQPFSESDQHMAKYFVNRAQVIDEIAHIIESLKATALQEEKEYLIDPITYQYLSSAVIVPSGTTYNESTLKEHFKNNGYQDPITRQVFQIGEKVVVRNNSLHNFAVNQKKKVTKDDIQLLKY